MTKDIGGFLMLIHRGATFEDAEIFIYYPTKRVDN